MVNNPYKQAICPNTQNQENLTRSVWRNEVSGDSLGKGLGRIEAKELSENYTAKI